MCIRDSSRGVAAYINLPGDTGKKSMAALITDKGPDLLTSYLMNLDYLDIKSSSLLKKKKDKAVADAKKSNIPLVLFTEVIEKGDEWLAIIELLFSSDGKKLSVVKGTAGDPFEAMDKALRTLDENYRKAVTKGDFRKKLNLAKDAQGLAVASRLTVDKFDVGQIFPSLVGFYRNNGIGTITLKNSSGSKLSDVEITYRVGDKVVGTGKVDDIPVKGSVVSKVELDVIPESNEGFSQMHAQITFKSDDTYGRRDAYAPLMIHSKNLSLIHI